MLPENSTFFVRGDDGEEYGPVDLAELREWVQENRAGLGTAVRRDEPDAVWHPWQQYPELVALLAEAHVTSPVPGVPGLVIAPLGRRVLAYGLDMVLCMILLMPIMIDYTLLCIPDWLIKSYADNVRGLTPPELPPQANETLSLIFTLLLTLYFTGFHAAHGRTPGKSLLRLRVVDQEGRKPNLFKSFLRAVGLILSMYFYGIPLAYAFFNPERRTFHDYVAGTYVVEA